MSLSVGSIVKEYKDESEPNYVFCSIIPPHMEAAARAHKKQNGILSQEEVHRHNGLSHTIRTNRCFWHHETQPKKPNFHVYSAQHKEDLPGVQIFDVSASNPNQDAYRAYTAAQKTFQTYMDLFNRDSVDGKGFDLNSSVDFDVNYDNAFWNGKQMVYGNGDGKIFGDFTVPLDVIGHELTHGVTQFSSNLKYENQPGALNEHLSDAFGKIVQHYDQSKTAKDPKDPVFDDTIGKGLILPYNGVQFKGLRSMANPGTAYKGHPALGDDPQPGTMADYQTLPNTDDGDNGGVHINSGIPNHAFWLFHQSLQDKDIGPHDKRGFLFEIPAQIWYNTSQSIKKNCDFKTFANDTIAAIDRLEKQNKYFSKMGVDTAKVHDNLLHSWKVVLVK